MVYTKFLVDEFSPIAVYNIVNSFFKDRIFLFESVINNSDGNYSFIFVGEKESLNYKNYTLEYFNGKESRLLNQDPFTFLKKYYKKID